MFHQQHICSWIFPFFCFLSSSLFVCEFCEVPDAWIRQKKICFCSHMKAFEQKHTEELPVPGGDGLITADILSSLHSEASGCMQNHIQGFSFETASVSQSKKMQDTIHSALTYHFPPTAHSCALLEIKCDTDDRDLGGQAELRILLQRRRQLSQLKIYGRRPSPSSSSWIHLPPRRRDRSGKKKKNNLSNLAIRCQEACMRPVRCGPASIGAEHPRLRWNMQGI